MSRGHSPRRRLDAELLRRGLVANRREAEQAVEAGEVLVGGALAAKPARLVGADEAIVVLGEPARFVGRGGDKLDAALVGFGLDVTGTVAVDVGASTGGFTDCLLQRGAARVVAVDVGHGQLHPKLRGDRRVQVLEHTDVRDLDVVGAGGPFEVVVVDVAFISLRGLAPILANRLCRPGGELVALVKPQFEVGRVAASRARGVVRDPGAWERALAGVAAAFDAAGATVEGVLPSPIRGRAGNVEFLLWVRPGRGGGARAPGWGVASEGMDVGAVSPWQAWAEAAVRLVGDRRPEPTEGSTTEGAGEPEGRRPWPR